MNFETEKMFMFVVRTDIPSVTTPGKVPVLVG